MNKKVILASALAIALSAGIVSASAYQGNGEGQGQQKPNFSPEKHQAVQTAMESGDYEAWVEAMGDKKAPEQITADNFAQFVEMKNLFREKNVEEGKAMWEELGLEKGEGMMGRQAKGHFKQMRFEDKNGDGFCDHLDKDVK